MYIGSWPRLPCLSLNWPGPYASGRGKMPVGGPAKLTRMGWTLAKQSQKAGRLTPESPASCERVAPPVSLEHGPRRQYRATTTSTWKGRRGRCFAQCPKTVPHFDISTASYGLERMNVLWIRSALWSHGPCHHQLLDLVTEQCHAQNHFLWTRKEGSSLFVPKRVANLHLRGCTPIIFQCK